MSAPGRLGGLDARLERRHHVDDLRLARLDRRQLELLAGGLATDQVEDLDPVSSWYLSGSNSAVSDLTSTFDRNPYQEVREGYRGHLPAARFEVVAADTATTVEVSLLRYESTLDLQNTDGTIITIRAICAVDPNVLAVTTIS
jgi:hypothetical protein